MARNPAAERVHLGLAADLEAAPSAPIFTFGLETARAFGRLADRAAWPASRTGDLEGRLLTLAPLVRRRATLAK